MNGITPEESTSYFGNQFDEERYVDENPR